MAALVGYFVLSFLHDSGRQEGLCRCSILCCLCRASVAHDAWEEARYDLAATTEGPVEYFRLIGYRGFRKAIDIRERECSKTPILSEGYVQQGRSHSHARSVHSVREHGRMVTMSVRAKQAKPENAASGFFQHSHKWKSLIVFVS